MLSSASRVPQSGQMRLSLSSLERAGASVNGLPQRGQIDNRVTLLFIVFHPFLTVLIGFQQAVCREAKESVTLCTNTQVGI